MNQCLMIRRSKSIPPYYLVFPVLMAGQHQTQLRAKSLLNLPRMSPIETASLVALFDAKTYFIYCCLDSVRRRISRQRFSWPAPKSVQRKDPNASLRSHSLSSTKRWRTIGRLLRTRRSHSPCSGPFVLLGPRDPFEMDLWILCCVQITEVADLISFGKSHHWCAINACMPFPSGPPFLSYL